MVHQRLRPARCKILATGIPTRRINSNGIMMASTQCHSGVLRYMVQIARRSFAFTLPYEFQRRAATDLPGNNARKTLRHSHHTVPATLANRINIAPNEIPGLRFKLLRTVTSADGILLRLKGQMPDALRRIRDLSDSSPRSACSSE
jgi:hypothetical protein